MRVLGWVAVGIALTLGAQWLFTPRATPVERLRLARKANTSGVGLPLRATLVRAGHVLLRGRGAFVGPTDYYVRANGHAIPANGRYRIYLEVGGHRYRRTVIISGR